MVSLIGGVLFLWQSETQDMENQEVAGSVLADEYLLSISESNLVMPDELEESPMEGMDEFEYEYLPTDFIQPFSAKTTTVGSHEEYMLLR